MAKHPVIMKMHNEDGVLYRTMYEKDPFHNKRRIFIPTTGLNNIERPIEDIIAEKIEEVIDDVAVKVKNTAEEISRTAERIEADVYRKLEKDHLTLGEAVRDTIGELALKALKHLLK